MLRGIYFFAFQREGVACDGCGGQGWGPGGPGEGGCAGGEAAGQEQALPGGGDCTAKGEALLQLELNKITIK